MDSEVTQMKMQALTQKKDGDYLLAGSLSDTASLYFTARHNEYDGPVNMWTRELSLPLTHPNVLDTGINPYHQRETDGYSLELTFEQDGYDITSLTSYTDTYSERFTDVDLMPEFILDFIRPEDMQVTTQEIRFTSNGDSDLQWIAGVYYSKFEEEMNSLQLWRDARVDADGNITGASWFGYRISYWWRCLGWSKYLLQVKKWILWKYLLSTDLETKCINQLLLI